MSEKRTILPGSDRKPLQNAELRGAVPSGDPIEVTLVLRRRAELPAEAVTGAPLGSDELGDKYGASAEDIDAVTKVLQAAGAQVLQVHAASRRLRVAGSAGQLAALFGARLSQASVPTATGQRLVRARTGPLSLPHELAEIVVAVLGLDDRPQSVPKLRIAPGSAQAGTAPGSAQAGTAPAAAQGRSYTPLDLARIYGLPEADGTGQTVAIIELGGGFDTADLTTYFGGLGVGRPKVTAVGVDGAKNQPGKDPSGADGEVLLDIDVVGAIVPAAHTVVYFAPNTDAGFLDAVSTAAHAHPSPAALSISWGQSEDDWTAQARQAMDAAFADAAALGITVTVAAGDDGSTDRASDSEVHVDFPASSPHVLACGGTNLVADPKTGTVTSETVWNNGPGNGATGGGVSARFPLPRWQVGVGVGSHPKTGKPGRGVPDVAADADPTTGYQVLIDGTATVIGGTSAVAPLWAGLAARLAQLTGTPLGLLAPKLYAGASAGKPVTGLRDIEVGNNGQYRAAPGWDACTGLGVPDGAALLQRLKAAVPPPAL